MVRKLSGGALRIIRGVILAGNRKVIMAGS